MSVMVIQLNKLYIVLAVFARFVRDCEDVDDGIARAAELDAADPDSQATKAARAAYVAKVIEAAKDWRTVHVNSWQYLERFRGPPVNARSKPHKDHKHKIYKECISERWASQSAVNARILEKAPSAPPTFRIFGLDIPEALIPEDDLAWLRTLDDEEPSEEPFAQSSEDDHE